jgi:hypothetical protein
VTRGVAATLSVTLFFAGAWSLGAWHGATAAASLQAPATLELLEPSTASSIQSGWSSLPVPLIEEPQPEGRRDRYGNEVTDAIATYKRDRAGSVYEEHSPQTEVPQLAPPTI